MVIFFAAFVFSAGCTGSDGQSGQTQTPTETAQATTEATETQALPSDMVPGPTEQPSSDYTVAIQVNKDQVYGTITVYFMGGSGQNFVSTITVDVYYPDGASESKNLSYENIGDSVEFPANKYEQDRVKVTAVYPGTIGTYVVYDQLVPQDPPLVPE
ncbi:hypothetical protein J2128_000188 [Methanomicrobium sp. W14]|uniref:hypothetical protein n=1 Tax=Methanomicrobium sp. W14 TaxID=2817839 RepID=UPI001FD87731|nr:hypothetical protein [Methanomicrobium sp. W14]MBP2132267.1 hypothetical protein [Methanomicrobium sp. W14]